MSAVFGIVGQHAPDALAQRVRRMGALLKPRAPDGVSLWSENGVALGHGLLKTLEGAPQPLRTGSLTLVGDIRLDNGPELASALGCAVDPEADAELVLTAYARWGEGCGERFEGDYAFAIWDSAEKTLLCARDRFGVRPFYYALESGALVFASEVKAVLAGLTRPSAVDPERVADFLVGLPPPIDATWHPNLKRLPPAHVGRFKGGGWAIRSYWTLAVGERRSGAETSAQFKELFTTAVRRRLRGPGPVAALVSGGLDSSSVACTAEQLLRSSGSGALRTYSLVFGERLDEGERPYMEAVYRSGVFNPTFVQPASALDSLDELLRQQDGPVLAPGLGLTRALQRAAGAHGDRVVLDGHGGDEVVSHGLERLDELASQGRWLRLWREVQGGVALYGGSARRSYFAYLKAHSALARAPGRLRRALLRIAPAQSVHLERLNGLNSRFRSRTGVSERLAAAAAPQSIDSAVQAHVSILCQPLQSHILEVMDKAFAAHAIEFRAPFWDLDLVRFCVSLDPREKLDRGWTRAVLRRAMGGVLPEEVRWRRDKLDFSFAIADSIRSDHERVLAEIDQGASRGLFDYVDRAHLSRLWEAVGSGGPLNGYDLQQLQRILAFAAWLRSEPRISPP